MSGRWREAEPTGRTLEDLPTDGRSDVVAPADRPPKCNTMWQEQEKAQRLAGGPESKAGAGEAPEGGGATLDHSLSPTFD